MPLSHVDEEGRARQVDVSGKAEVPRRASAFARVRLAPETVRLIRDNQMRKGDVLAVAQIAGIAAAKRTSELIPLCHNIPIDQVEVRCTVTDGGVEIRSEAACTARTGIEMEALTAAAVAALTVYDMCKAVDKGMVIEEVRLLAKSKMA
ncbi:MAG: molybdenum cofactor biosynthesis protein C [Spirochaetes bacterium RBG_16_67_19]|nr:MAG: molybdenum cofactor biosynthesis protein C [Spirochaetes bacterium RBG_16_67_19]